MHRNLGKVCGRACLLLKAYMLAADMDEGFDAGEYSAPAAHRALHRAVERLAKAHGYASYAALHEEATRRTSARWTYMHMPHPDA